MKEDKRGRFLLECRKKKNLSQEQLGELIKYSRNNISKWERGFSFPSDPNVLEKLSEIFDVSIEELMYGEYKSKTNTKQIINNLVQEYKIKYKALAKRNIMILSLIMTLILIIIASIYFVFIRGTISLYQISISDDNFTLGDSVLFISNSVSILNFNELKTNNSENIKQVELYYKEGDSEVIVFSGDNVSRFIKEDYGYDEYNLNELLTKELYLYVETDLNEYKDIKIILTKEYVNNNIFPLKIPEISSSDTSRTDLSLGEKLKEAGFIEESDECYVKTLDNDVTIMFFSDFIRITIPGIDYNNYEIITGTFNTSNYQYAKIKNNEIVEEKEITSDISQDCNIQKCVSLEDYISYMNYLIKFINE